MLMLLKCLKIPQSIFIPIYTDIHQVHVILNMSIQGLAFVLLLSPQIQIHLRYYKIK